MEQFVSMVVGLSTSKPSDLNHLLDFLKQQESLLSNAHEHLGHLLAELDPREHSLGTLFVLDAQFKEPPSREVDDELIRYTTDFLLVCSENQVRLAPAQFCSVCRQYKDKIVSKGCYRLGILPLKAAIRKLQIDTNYLTPIHADVFQLCLLSKCYNAAADLLQEDVFHVDPTKTGMTTTDLLLYSYYGGMICTGRHMYARALELFLLAMATPTTVSNAITVAVCKRFLLVSLIHSGSVAPLPKYIPTKVRQVMDHDCRPYQDLVSSYTAYKVEKMKKTCEQNQQIYQRDVNHGLVKLVMQSFTRRSIQRLTQTYLTLSLEDIATLVGIKTPQQVEAHIISMVHSGEIFARVNQRDGMVEFLEEPEGYDRMSTVDRLHSLVQNSLALTSRLQKAHDDISLNRGFLQKVVMKERGRYDFTDDFPLGPIYPGTQ